MRVFKEIVLRSLATLGIAIFSFFLCTSCVTHRTTRILNSPGTIIEKKEVFDKNDIVKLHLKNGEAYILDSLKIDPTNKFISGRGFRLDINRIPIDTGRYSVNISDIALIVVNDHPSLTPSTTILTVMTIVTLAVGVACIINPKACFGSCPTFYASDGDDMIIQSEGFSSSIAPSLEARDVDALYRVHLANSVFEIGLTNEALETHIIRYVKILAVPKPENGRVIHTDDNEFYELTNMKSPVSVVDPLGETTHLFSGFDGKERYSLADSNDLTKKETVELTFNNNQPGEKGLALAFRQTLMTTFLYYQIDESYGIFAFKIKNNSYGKINRKAPQIFSICQIVCASLIHYEMDHYRKYQSSPI